MAPFDHYEKKGRELLGKVKESGNCRHDYGLPVLRQCGTSCAYCGRDLACSYEAWLNISIDHVIPRSTAWYHEREDWVEDIINIVTCCRACNEFLNRHRVQEPRPDDLSAFVDLRDKVFSKKETLALNRHKEERAWYERWLAAEADTKKNP